MQSTARQTLKPTLRAGLASNPKLRAIALPLLRRFDRPITIKNPYARMPIRLLSYTHKGYWFYGKQRESQTMRRFASLIQPGDTVFEVGGHIGFIAQFFSRKVGRNGQVHVFEPGQQNQQFLRQNIARCRNCAHIDAAVSDKTGQATFYEENVGGFMNSLDADFAPSSDIAASQGVGLQITPRHVQTITLDAYALRHGLSPNFIKIDVEGAELAVLRGATAVLVHARASRVEVARDKAAVFDILTNAGFTLSTETGTAITKPSQMHGNVFGTRRPRAMDARL
jgi:FkbM family methyltransferase